MPTFHQTTPIAAPQDALFGYHAAAEGSFERLAPPWETLQVFEKQGTIRDGDRLRFGIRKMGMWLTWEARHEGYIEGEQFRDIAVKSPFAHWSHTHRFKPAEGGSELEDELEWRLPLGWLGALFGNWQARRVIRRMFRFRQERTRHDVERIHEHADKPRLRVAITGSTGLVGTQLTHFLRAAGHTVLGITRSPKGDDQIGWDPAKGEIDAAKLDGVDAVVNLAGENVAQRWSDAAKKRIRASRVDGTALIARTIASMDRKPSVLISASASGYYGSQRRDTPASESDGPGEDFLASVCVDWENAAAPARDAGIRTVHPRIGVVLSPKGGALAKLLTPFSLGLGGPIGPGNQWMPWIALDDVVGSLHHLLHAEQAEGPVNLVAPTPMENRRFVRAIGHVLRRPTLFPLPSIAVKTLFGEMGVGTILADQYLAGDRLAEWGYACRHPELEGALRHELGRYRF